MRSNYKKSEHRIYHAWRCTVDCVGAAAPIVWHGFLQPVLVLAFGVGLAAPVARVLGSFIGNWIGG